MFNTKLAQEIIANKLDTTQRRKTHGEATASESLLDLDEGRMSSSVGVHFIPI